MILKYKLLTDEEGHRGVAPKVMTPGSACFDLALPTDIEIPRNRVVTVPLLVAFDLPETHYIAMYPRSSMLVKHGVHNPASIVDSDYKGGIHAILHNTNLELDKAFRAGDRVVQALVLSKLETTFKEVDIIEDSGRGGLGSTDTVAADVIARRILETGKWLSPDNSKVFFEREGKLYLVPFNKGSKLEALTDKKKNRQLLEEVYSALVFIGEDLAIPKWSYLGIGGVIDGDI